LATRLAPGSDSVAQTFLTGRRDQIVTLANHCKLPALYEWREFAITGGLR